MGSFFPGFGVKIKNLWVATTQNMQFCSWGSTNWFVWSKSAAWMIIFPNKPKLKDVFISRSRCKHKVVFLGPKYLNTPWILVYLESSKRKKWGQSIEMLEDMLEEILQEYNNSETSFSSGISSYEHIPRPPSHLHSCFVLSIYITKIFQMPRWPPQTYCCYQAKSATKTESLEFVFIMKLLTKNNAIFPVPKAIQQNRRQEDFKGEKLKYQNTTRYIWHWPPGGCLVFLKKQYIYIYISLTSQLWFNRESVIKNNFGLEWFYTIV